MVRNIGEQIVETASSLDFITILLHSAAGYTKQVFENPDYITAWFEWNRRHNAGEDVKLHCWGFGWRVVARPVGARPVRSLSSNAAVSSMRLVRYSSPLWPLIPRALKAVAGFISRKPAK